MHLWRWRTAMAVRRLLSMWSLKMARRSPPSPLPDEEMRKRAVVEAQAAGRPVIGAVRGEARDILTRSGGALLVDPERGDQLARAIEHLRADPHLRAELGRRGRAFAEQHYDRDVLAGRYLDVLREVVRSA